MAAETGGQTTAVRTDPEVRDEIIATVRRFVANEVIPVASALEHGDRLPEEIVARWGALAGSEADSGSDTRNISCRAVRDGDEYVINGTKAWVTNGARAGILAL